MNAIKLYHQDGKPSGVFYCEKCRCVKRTEEEANECCQPYICKAAFAATHGWAVGDIAEAAHDITIGLFQSKVLVPEGARLVICGSSGNGLHPIAVHREDDEHLTLAVSASNLRRPNDRTERPAGQAGSSQPKESNDR